ncbi:hypothetical protein H5410_036091 [Solanum commersonii]|uniref:Myb-like domain-containing protein n=1 Tax=Solanum commersonii TaxID=4109 RepID=A0A9J5Y2K1_SOLCO|nr:hypothetical protein H5410_036091 [Solanum commersonii]
MTYIIYENMQHCERRSIQANELLRGTIPPPKKSRFVWTDSLHEFFLEAITTLGMERAYPKKIIELMDIPELTSRHIAYHLKIYYF